MRLKLLQLATELSNVNHACRLMGYSSTRSAETIKSTESKDYRIGFP